MKKRTSWPQEMRNVVTSSDDSLFSIAYDSQSESAEFQTPAMRKSTSSLLFRFCLLVANGESPKQAFDKVYN